MKKLLTFIANTVLPIVFIVFAVIFTRRLIAGRDAPDAQPSAREAATVSVVEYERTQIRPTIEAHGIVVAARELTVQPEVSGRIESVHPNLVAGGIVREGDELVRIDTRDYRLAVREAESAIEQAQTQLTLEQGRQQLATSEWQAYASLVGSAADGTLAMREPQLRAAELAVEAAEIRLDRARLNQSRTTLRAPLDALVLAESAEPGQLVSAQSQIARLVGIDEFWVELSVPFDALSRFDLPGVNATTGATVTVRPGSDATAPARTGRVLRLLGQLDNDARMARVLVSVADPLNSIDPTISPAAGSAPPLLLGAYVTSSIESNRELEVIRVPSETLRAGGQIWVMSDAGLLEIHPFEFVANEGANTLILAPLEPGDRVVRSHLGSPVTGMALRTVDAAEAPAEAIEGSR